MNWITNYVRPTINSLFSRREVPENLWTKCPECGTMLFHRELADNLNVCTSCEHHMAISPRDRFNALFDAGVFIEVKVPEPVADPLHFRDQKKYPERLKAAQKATGEREAMLVAEGEVGRTPSVAAAQDFSFMAGSMGVYVGSAIVAAAERAVKLKRPLVLFSAAGGARMQEGILSLMQMPRTTVAVQMLKEAGLPYIVVLTHPTTGGVTASYAMLGEDGHTLFEAAQHEHAVRVGNKRFRDDLVYSHNRLRSDTGDRHALLVWPHSRPGFSCMHHPFPVWQPR